MLSLAHTYLHTYIYIHIYIVRFYSISSGEHVGFCSAGHRATAEITQLSVASSFTCPIHLPHCFESPPLFPLSCVFPLPTATLPAPLWDDFCMAHMTTPVFRLLFIPLLHQHCCRILESFRNRIFLHILHIFPCTFNYERNFHLHVGPSADFCLAQGENSSLNTITICV